MPSERFRRTIVGGYDPEQVRAALDERDQRLAALEREAQRLARRVIEAEQSMQGMLTGSAEAATGAVGQLGRRIEEIHGQARRQATRIRMAALEDAVAISDRIVELAHLRDELGARVAELAENAGLRQMPDVRGPADGVFAGPVQVEVGPLRDFAQMSGFEDAAAAIEAAEDVRVQRFADGRATFSMRFGEPTELLRELEERAPFDFQVRDTRTDGIVLDVDAEAGGGGENRAA